MLKDLKDFEDLRDLISDKPYWSIRIAIYILMIIIGFSLHAHYESEYQKYEAMEVLITLHTQEGYKYPFIYRTFEENPKIKELTGMHYETLKKAVIKVQEGDTKAKRDAVSLILDPIILSSDFPLLTVIEKNAETSRDRQLFWLMGCFGIFLFIVGIYMGMK